MVLLSLLLNQLLILLPFGVLLRFHLYGEVFIYPHDIVILLIFLLTAVYHIKKRVVPAPNKVFISLSIFVMVCLISLLWNIPNLSLSQFIVSFSYLFRFIIYSSLIFSFGLLKKDFTKSYTKKIILSGFLFVLFGILQYIFYPSLKSMFYLGWDEHLYRLTSTVMDPNFAGPLIIFETLLLMGLLFIKRDKIRKSYRLLFFAGLFTSCTAILLTYSRSSLLMFVASSSMFFILLKKTKLIFVFILIVLLGIIIVPKDFKIEGMNLFRTVSTNERIETIQRSIKIFQSSPVIGVGFNAYRYAQKNRGFLDSRWDITHSGAGVSNSYFFILATTGAVGFAFFIDFLIVLFQALRSVKDGKMKIISIAALSGVLVHSLFENTFFYPFIAIWLFIIIGITVCKKQ